ncbi:hypothetical protein [Escherichia coli]
MISKEVIKKIYDSTPDYPNLREKLQATKDRLLRYWEKQLLKQQVVTPLKINYYHYQKRCNNSISNS